MKKDNSRADLSGADLSGADFQGANLRRADLRRANLQGADLRRADLRRANLSGANLEEVFLEGANLEGANLEGASLIRVGERFDGHTFYAWKREGVLFIKAGCRHFSAEEARHHWIETRGETSLGKESIALVDSAEIRAAARGII